MFLRNVARYTFVISLISFQRFWKLQGKRSVISAVEIISQYINWKNVVFVHIPGWTSKTLYFERFLWKFAQSCSLLVFVCDKVKNNMKTWKIHYCYATTVIFYETLYLTSSFMSFWCELKMRRIMFLGIIWKTLCFWW